MGVVRINKDVENCYSSFGVMAQIALLTYFDLVELIDENKDCYLYRIEGKNVLDGDKEYSIAFYHDEKGLFSVFEHSILQVDNISGEEYRENDNIIILNTYPPMAYGNLKNLCQTLNVAYSTYNKKSFPFQIKGVDVFKIKVVRSRKKV